MGGMGGWGDRTAHKEGNRLHSTSSSLFLATPRPPGRSSTTSTRYANDTDQHDRDLAVASTARDMTESSQAQTQARARPQRIDKRRGARLTYHHDNISRYFNNSSPESTREQDPNSSSSSSSSRFPVQAHQSPGDPISYLDLLGFQAAPTNAPGLGQQGQYPDASCLVSYTFPSLPPNSSLPPQSAPVSPLAPVPSQTSGHGYRFASQASAADALPPDSEDIDMSLPGSRVGSFDSLDSFSSMAPSLGTQASSVSDGYVWPLPGSAFNSPAMAHAIGDLSLSEGYFRTGQLLDPSYSPDQMGSPQINDVFPLDNDYMNVDWANPNDFYGTECGNWTPTPSTHQQLLGNGQPLIPTELTHSPWSVERLPANLRADAGCVAFEPARGAPYDTFRAREEYLHSRQEFPVVFGPEPVSPVVEEERDDWEVINSYAGSSTMHDSPKSDGVSWYQVDSSPQDSPSPYQVGGQSYVFSTRVSGSLSPKPPRGRQRALTTKEKREALVVRKAKACWACHLSKIKCSPCSQGTPCQQCERLNGKRRFCLLSCFNDTLESLQTFVVPDYLTGHLTQAKVEAVIAENATSWGTYEMRVRMDWGYEKPLEATVVALALPNQSRLAYHHQTNGTVAKKPTMVRKKSPPLGIPLASYEDMKEEYGEMVSAIVMGDLENYVPVPYDNQESELPERLLQIICSFYRAGLAADQECKLLREAIATHVISTILERSLVLDDDSLCAVEEHLGEEYPARSAPNCAARQIKFALFLAQREQVFRVLQEWGAMMWTSNKTVDVEQKWATSFGVLVMLILVVDKMVESAYLFCESSIKNHGHEAAAEQRAFEELVRLTQTELFERCKEIFHSSFKTRKGGREACNPIRDGLEAFRGRPVPEGISRLVWDLQSAHREFGPEIRSQRTSSGQAGTEGGEYYGNAGRLASVFLGDFLE